MSKLIKAEETTLAELLKSGLYSVPKHQRYYDWDSTHVHTLLADIAEATKQDAPCHFLGSIMLIKNDEDNRWEINDGQQRIITYSLICAYLCKNFHDQGETEKEIQLLSILFDLDKLHNKTLDDSDNLSLRITPPVENEIDFNLLLRGHNVERKEKMIIAWNIIAKFFESPQYKTLAWKNKTLKFILHKILVIRLEVHQSLDANAIFETLNYRGKKLDQVDLIKNYFLSFLTGKEKASNYKKAHRGFEKIHQSLPKSISKYVRCYMQTQYGFINKEKFFQDTRNRFGNPKNGEYKEVIKLIDNLAKGENIEIFKTVRQKYSNTDFLHQLTTDANKTKSKRKIHAFLLDLHEFTITRPLVFSLFSYYVNAPKNEKEERAIYTYNCLKFLASFVQRMTHIGSFKPTAYESKFAALATIIAKNKCATTKQFLDHLKNNDHAQIISDQRYIDEMKNKFYTPSSTKKSSYILKRIVEHELEGIIINDDQINIEYILPKSNEHNSKPAWAEKFNEDEKNRLIYCLGNLTLLNIKDKIPEEDDNKSFSAKKNIYQNSTYQLTKDIPLYKEWTPEILQKRQAQLATTAAKQIWNFNL